MKAILGTLATSLLIGVVGFFLGLIVLVQMVANTNAAGADAALGILAIQASEDAVADIPALLLPIYIEAAETCPGLPWTVIAGIGKVESNHGRYGGAAITADGTIVPPIIGIPLNGTNNTRAIPDTDNGVYDGDTIWDRAVGPFQFIPTSWAIFGRDGNGDGIKDPNNVYDAIPAAVAHLCPNGQITDIEAAIFSYNHSSAYVEDVLAWADLYTGAVSGVPIAGYALPIAGMSQAQATRPHHTYPAIDVGVPVGTPTFAMVDGTITTAIKSNAVFNGSNGRCGSIVIVTGIDGVTYTYCHLSAVMVTSGQSVTAGQQLGNTGGQPGAPGAGNTTGPHLHMSMKGGGRTLCPQPLVLSIVLGTPVNPLASPSSGCISGQSNTNWTAWLATQTPIAPTPIEDATDAPS